MPLSAIHNEEKLLLEIASGNEKAFAELFYAYHAKLGEFVLSLTGSPEMTEEIIQDVFLKVWQRRSLLPDLKSFLSWLFIITRNHTLNVVRRSVNERQHKHVFIESHTVETEIIPDPSADAEYDLLLDRAIAQLPRQQQKAYVLSRKYGMANSFIARQLSVSPDSVKKYLQWARLGISRFIRSHAELIIIFLVSSLLV